MLETIQKLAPWASGLPLFPKVAITIVILLLGFVFLYLVWVPVYHHPEVKQAYERMSRVLSRLERLPNGTVTVDGKPVKDRLSEYYNHYVTISEYLEGHPEDIKGRRPCL